MSVRVLTRGGATAGELEQGIARIHQEQHLEAQFPPAVEKAAAEDAAHPRLPDLDRTDLELVTIDPAGSMDLDQAMHLEASVEGYVVHYAIADVMAFVDPGDPVDVEAHARGESLYGADSKIPLHPVALSEAAASLLPDQVRPAFLWTLELDATGEVTRAHVERARVRSRERLDYASIHARLAQAHEGSTLALLKTVGELRLAREAERGGVSLPMPEQVVDLVEGRWVLGFREMLPVESWNAQISLVTGFAAASIMLEGKIGVLRTLPPAPDHAVTRLRRTARALGVAWPPEQSAPDFIRSLEPSIPADAAMVVACTTLLRGAGYAAFDGELPASTEHAALASAYAHVTAPLRRLVDRYGLEVCAALCAGDDVPAWARAGLAALPQTMQESGHRAHAYEKAVLDLAEALTLRGRVGESYPAVVLEADRDDERKGAVMVRDPAVEAEVSSARPVPVGDEVTVRLVEADPETRRVRFEL